MSKIGKNVIIVPPKTDVVVGAGAVTVKGPLGSLSRSLSLLVTVSVADGTVTVVPGGTSKFARSVWGTTAAHIKNMIAGVNTKYEKKLLLEGIGYRAELQGKNLKFLVGFSHPVLLSVPSGIDVSVDKNLITISGIDKEAVGQYAAIVRSVKKPEPYKGKGIRYEGEYVRRKQGKKVTA